MHKSMEKRKLLFLPTTYSKEFVDAINSYFDKGYEIDNILNAEDGYYILLILKGIGNYVHAYVNDYSKPSNGKSKLIEENKNFVDC